MQTDEYITTVATAEGPSYALVSPTNDALVLLTIRDAQRLQREETPFRPSYPVRDARKVAGTVYSST